MASKFLGLEGPLSIDLEVPFLYPPQRGYISFVNTFVTPRNNDLGPYVFGNICLAQNSKTFELCLSVRPSVHPSVVNTIASEHKELQGTWKVRFGTKFGKHTLYHIWKKGTLGIRRWSMRNNWERYAHVYICLISKQKQNGSANVRLSVRPSVRLSVHKTSPH